LADDFSGTMKLLRDESFQDLLVNYPRPPRRFVVAPEADDEVSSAWLIRDGAGNGHKPEDYLAAFARYVQENPDHIEAVGILLDRPQDWGTDALAELRSKLSASKLRFTEGNLQKAHAAHYHKSLVDIISMVKHAARESEPLLTAAERVDSALARLTKDKTFNDEQQKWLGRIREHLISNLTIDRGDFDELPIFSREGGWGRANKAFGGQLAELIEDINEALAA
jgi:type I restriction enzyme R subunit